MASFDTLWRNHPYPYRPCSNPDHTNQCAIRMGEALRLSNISLSSFRGVKCWDGHNPRHILRAEQLANWLTNNFSVTRTVHENVTYNDFINKKGIVFIKDGWGAGDHIDLWDGINGRLKGGALEYFAKGKEVWFWELP